MDKQNESINRLERQGWQFANWISAHDPENPEAQVAVMVKKPRPSTTHYCEVNPNGEVI